jgi:hypothetical protein
VVLSRRRLYTILVLGFPGLAGCAPGKPALHFEGYPASEHFGTVLATGGSSEDFSVRVADAEPDAPSVSGSYTREDGGIRFRPRFPFTAGLSYRARFEDAEIVFTMPEPDPGEPPRVEAIYPTTVDVPENLLRIYVEFSRPMREKGVHRHVRLEDAEGREVADAFVEVETGLWDREGRRLTLFFHPGRIKRGVGPNVALGPPLREGNSYRLVVDREMTDARGYPLEAAIERELQVGPSDRVPPNPGRWTVSPPPDPAAPVHVAFDEILDRALLVRFVRVETSSGERVAGETRADADERGVTFTPEEPWAPGDYRVVVHPEIEDLAGNTPARLFDVEAGATRAEVSEGIEIPFVLIFHSSTTAGTSP